MANFEILQEDIDMSFLPDLPATTSSPASSTLNFQDEDLNLESEATTPARDSSPVQARKERRLPSITPSKFKHFFTPRSLKENTSRQALSDITAPNDRPTLWAPSRPSGFVLGLDSSPDPFSRDMKRRKFSYLTAEIPDETFNGSNDDLGGASSGSEEITGSGKVLDATRMSPFKRAARRNVDKDIIAQATVIPKPKTILEDRGLSGRLLQMSFGSASTSGRRFTAHAVGDYQNETANFYSKPVDTHLCNSRNSGEVALPFCTATCNRSTLVALGDEHGQVKILESEAGGKPPFNHSYVAFKNHTNAIFDLSFSEDDSLLATASADQTAKVVDMVTQSTISTLAQHTASVKQVRFQPGSSNNSVLATSSRDGSIEIWDLRCRGNGGPIKEIFHPNDPILDRVGRPGYGYAINSIYEAHKNYVPPPVLGATKQRRASERAAPPSVTSIAFMPPGQEHLLLSASEDNASVRVWDIRSIYKTHKEWAIPLSCTALPESHHNWRQYGVASMNLGGDGSRLYTLCKDNTIYAYSTAHLILGYAPELDSTSAWRRPAETSRKGLGALYGFRHPRLLTSSFYVKTDLRKEKDGKCEMLAVGSSKDGSAILFPTDERYHNFSKLSSEEPLGPILRKRPHATRTSSGRPLTDDVPISQNGTALIAGHEKEVSSLAWTSNGELITLSDDYLVRCWREGPEARELRVGGEEGGQRWISGWAEVDEAFDDDDC